MPGATSILLVDDDSAILRLLARWLEQAGYKVATACDGYEAKLAIERECPHVVITDWEMPHVDGLELCRWVRTQDLPHYVYMLFLTVRGGLNDLVRGLESGADDFLKKPIDKDELLARMRSARRVLELEERLGVLARSDSLTGLASRRTFFEMLGREWSRSQRHRIPLSCVMVDIDYFKRVNDMHGHAAGDEVLRRVADCLSAGCRTSDVVSRHGGEEFCLLLPETTEYNAELWAERMRQKLAALTVDVGGQILKITASLGIAQRMNDTTTPEQLVDMADQALIVAKRSGRDRVVTFSSLSQATPRPTSSSSPAMMLQDVSARQVMTTLVAGLDQTDTVDVASRYFLRFRIAIAAVVDHDGKLVGVLSEKDVMAAMLLPEWWKLRIQDVMKANVVCYEEETPALTIYEFLCRVTLRAAVIVKQGQPTGLITRGSLLRFFTNTLNVGSESGGLEQYETIRPHEVTTTDDIRRRVLQIVRAVNDEAIDLRERLDLATDDLVPCLVGGASRVQELANDLLACSRAVSERTEPNVQGVLLG
ncbi:diguanylate cyclase [Anatilimnocola sp. NA78]|uniref:diguanylate cyclase n=1 Tax=Anatilimnocola sp. NA78 TaxID=3415683 RepID=UPI003CE5C2CB